MSDPIQNSPLARQNEIERRIALEGPQDPDNFLMPDGRTLTGTRAAMNAAHEEEGRASAEVQLQRTREQSIKDDPLYAEPPKVEADAAPVPAKRERPVRESFVDRPGGEGVV